MVCSKIMIRKSYLKWVSFLALSCCCVVQAFIIYMGLSNGSRNSPTKSNDEFGIEANVSVVDKYVGAGPFVANKSGNLGPFISISNDRSSLANKKTTIKHMTDFMNINYGNNVLVKENDYKHLQKWSSNSPLSTEEEWLLENPIYKRFNIEAPKQKKRVNIIVVVQTAPSAGERRRAVRTTWFKECIETKKV